jgi:hypothetical protein
MQCSLPWWVRITDRILKILEPSEYKKNFKNSRGKYEKATFALGVF